MATPMSSARKWLIVIIVCNAIICVTCISSIYTTTYTQLSVDFGVTTLLCTVGLSVYVLGIGTGPLLTSPLSERYGRRPIYLISWALFIIWTIPSAVATNIQTMIVARFFNGFFGGTFLSVAGGTVSDIFVREEIQAPMALVALAPFVGPSLGPVLGGFVNSYLHWRWTYYIGLIWAGITFVAISCFVPETMRRREKRPFAESRKLLLRPFQLLLLEPMCLCLDLYSAILLGILYLFFSTFPLIFQQTYGMNVWQAGLTFLGIIVGMCVAAASTPAWSRLRRYMLAPEAGNRRPESKPEHCLPPAILGGVLIPAGLFWFAWGIWPSVHWVVPIIGLGLFGSGILLAFMGIFTFLVDAYPRYSASVLAANGFVRCSFAAAFPMFGSQMYEKLGFHWATSLLAFLTLAMMPFPLIFFQYGETLRRKSKFAVIPVGT
ncbi:major facilitator superfamily domain-containing protein [Aspergillus heterothallicus]